MSGPVRVRPGSSQARPDSGPSQSWKGSDSEIGSCTAAESRAPAGDGGRAWLVLLQLNVVGGSSQGRQVACGCSRYERSAVVCCALPRRAASYVLVIFGRGKEEHMRSLYGAYPNHNAAHDKSFSLNAPKETYDYVIWKEEGCHWIRREGHIN